MTPAAPPQPPPPSGEGAPPPQPPPPGGGRREGMRALLAALVVTILVAAGLGVAAIVRFGCTRRAPPVAASVVVPSNVPADTIGEWVDRGDSLLSAESAGAAQDSARTRSGFDLWARALAARLGSSEDSLPSATEVGRILDSLQIPGEVEAAVGDAGIIGVALRPRSAMRARAPYAFYPASGHIEFLRLPLENAERVHFAGWRENGELQVGAAGVRRGPLPRPVASILARGTKGQWFAWDSIPPPDSLGGATASPFFQPRPNASPLLVVRVYEERALFDECSSCPHRYRDRVWLLERAHASWLSEQPEDTPYAGLVGFLEGLTRGDRGAAEHYAMDGSLVDLAARLRLDAPYAERSFRLEPGQRETDSTLTAARRGGEAYRFTMFFGGDHWRVRAIDPAPEATSKGL